MPWRETVETVPMVRMAVVGRLERRRELLVEVGAAGAVELEVSAEADSSDIAEALRRLRARGVTFETPLLASTQRSAADLERDGNAQLAAGELELLRRSSAGAERGAFVVFVGWCPQPEVDPLRGRLASLGGGVVELPRPAFVDPPTLLRTPRAAEPFRPLVEIYGTVRYSDIDPTPFTAFSFVLMFGMMFADAGHGLLLVLAGLFLRLTKQDRLSRLRKSWLLPVAAGLTAAAFGAAYGEFFGPTEVVPVVWLQPLQNPLELLVAGVAVGAILLAISYAIGTVNRIREGGVWEALLSGSGIAGSLLFAGLGAVTIAFFLHNTLMAICALAPALAGLVLLFIGFLHESSGGGTGVLEAFVELVNSIIRLGANSISFARLAAFGMVHAAIGSLVWSAVTGLYHGGLWFAAIPLFIAGNAIAFTLELVVAGIQAMRLQYYELFSRIYSGEGRAFEPWRPTILKEAP